MHLVTQEDRKAKFPHSIGHVFRRRSPETGLVGNPAVGIRKQMLGTNANEKAQKQQYNIKPYQIKIW